MVAIMCGSLNCRRLFGANSEGRIKFLLDPQFDIMLVQDIYHDILDSPEFRERWLVIERGRPMTNHWKRGGLRGEVGLGILSNHPIVFSSAEAYVHRLAPVSDLDGSPPDADGCANAGDLELLRQSESRQMLFVEVLKEGKRVKIGTTHGPQGSLDDTLRRDMAGLLATITTQHGDLVAAGAFNVERGKEIYQTFLDAGLKDAIPQSITNTIDWKMRGKSGPDLVVAGIYTKGSSLKVSGVRTHPGLSDHYGLSFTVWA